MNTRRLERHVGEALAATATGAGALQPDSSPWLIGGQWERAWREQVDRIGTENGELR